MPPLSGTAFDWIPLSDLPYPPDKECLGMGKIRS